MEHTDSFFNPATEVLLASSPAPTYQTFVVIVTGWILSQRHRYVTEVIFSGGQRKTATPVAISSLLQSCRLGHRLFLHAPGQAGGDDSDSRRHLLLGR